MAEQYPPIIADLLAVPHPTSLDAGSPNHSAGDRLRKLDAAAFFAPLPIRDADMARACLAGLWLRFDFLDESHHISQEIETPTGSAWHAIMHRREGDFGNSKYWWRRVGEHPALIGNPFDFVDAVEGFLLHRRDDKSALKTAELLNEAQEREWHTLFDFCVGRATGG